MAGICIPDDLPRITDPAIFSSPACLAVNCWDLMVGADVRGASTLIPHLPGRYPEPLLWDETEHTLQLIIVGDVDYTGAPIVGANTGVGLEANLNDLRAYIDPNGSTGSTWELTTPSGATREALVQTLGRLKVGTVVEGVDWLGIVGMAMTATLDIRLPDGAFV